MAKFVRIAVWNDGKDALVVNLREIVSLCSQNGKIRVRIRNDHWWDVAPDQLTEEGRMLYEGIYYTEAR